MAWVMNSLIVNWRGLRAAVADVRWILQSALQFLDVLIEEKNLKAVCGRRLKRPALMSCLGPAHFLLSLMYPGSHSEMAHLTTICRNGAAPRTLNLVALMELFYLLLRGALRNFYKCIQSHIQTQSEICCLQISFSVGLILMRIYWFNGAFGSQQSAQGLSNVAMMLLKFVDMFKNKTMYMNENLTYIYN